MAAVRHDLLFAWMGIGLAPFATVASFQARYMMVPFACQSRSNWSLHLVSVLAIAVVICGLVSAHRAWRNSGGGSPGDQDGPMNRNRFLGAIGMGFSSAMLLLLIFQLIPALVLDPCTIG